MCGVERFLIVLLAVIALLWLFLRTIKSGRVLADKMGFIDRRENRHGFWLATFINVIYSMIALAVIWGATSNLCRVGV